MIRAFLTVKNLVTRLYKFFEDAFYDIFYDKKDGQNNPLTFSLGRTSFVVWFYYTLKLTILGVQLSYLHYLVLLSLLAYIIGKQYIITSIGGVSFKQTSNLDEINEHP